MVADNLRFRTMYVDLDSPNGTVRLIGRAHETRLSFYLVGTPDAVVGHWAVFRDLVGSTDFPVGDRREAQKVMRELIEPTVQIFLAHPDNRLVHLACSIGYSVTQPNPLRLTTAVIGKNWEREKPKALRLSNYANLKAVDLKLKTAMDDRIHIYMSLRTAKRRPGQKLMAIRARRRLPVLDKPEGQTMGQMYQDLIHGGTEEELAAYQQNNYNDLPLRNEDMRRVHLPGGGLQFPDVISIRAFRCQPLCMPSDGATVRPESVLVDELFYTLSPSNGWPIRRGVTSSPLDIYAATDPLAVDAMGAWIREKENQCLPANELHRENNRKRPPC